MKEHLLLVEVLEVGVVDVVVEVPGVEFDHGFFVDGYY